MWCEHFRKHCLQKVPTQAHVTYKVVTRKINCIFKENLWSELSWSCKRATEEDAINTPLRYHQTPNFLKNSHKHWFNDITTSFIQIWLSWNDKITPLDYKLCVCTAFSFSVRIPSYAESRSLYAEVSMLLSKWPDINAEVLVWVRTRAHHVGCYTYEKHTKKTHLSSIKKSR